MTFLTFRLLCNNWPSPNTTHRLTQIHANLFVDFAAQSLNGCVYVCTECVRVCVCRCVCVVSDAILPFVFPNTCLVHGMFISDNLLLVSVCWSNKELSFLPALWPHSVWGQTLALFHHLKGHSFHHLFHHLFHHSFHRLFHHSANFKLEFSRESRFELIKYIYVHISSLCVHGHSFDW